MYISHILERWRKAKPDNNNITSSSTSTSTSPFDPYYVEGVALFTVGSIGVFINGAAIFLLGRQKPRRTFHVLLLTLAVFDLLHVSLSIFTFALPQLWPLYRNQALIFAIPYLIPLAQITLSSSSFSTVALTVERYISVCWPYLLYR